MTIFQEERCWRGRSRLGWSAEGLHLLWTVDRDPNPVYIRCPDEEVGAVQTMPMANGYGLHASL
jgi:hypothetical protein